MQITSNTQSQYANIGDYSNKKQTTESTEEELVEEKQLTRYEQLLAMDYDNMSEAERSERFHYLAMRPMPFLDDEGNEALNKSLEGKTDIKKFQIKSILELSFMTSVTSNAQGEIVREKFDSIDTSKDATISRFENYINDFNKSGSTNNIGIIDVMEDFLNIYKNNDSSYDINKQEDSVADDFLKDLYSKDSISTASTLVKEEIQNKIDKYSQTLEDALDNTQKSKMLNDYTQQILEELQTNLSDENSKSSFLEKQSIVKVLLDSSNNTNNASLETLLK